MITIIKMSALDYWEVVRRAEEVGRRAKLVREGQGGREIVDAVVVTAGQINNNPHFTQLRESMAYRNGFV